MTLSELHNKHLGSTGVLYGKGPSLLQHDFKLDAGPEIVRVAVNDAGYTVPACDYLFMHDAIPAATEVMRLTLQVSPWCRFVLPDLPAPYDFVSLLPLGAVIPAVCWYRKSWWLHPNTDDAARFGELWHGHCTAHSALHFLHVAGIRKVRLVGFDGVADNVHALTYQAVADALRAEMAKDPNHEAHATFHYARYRRMLLGVALVLGIEIVSQ